MISELVRRKDIEDEINRLCDICGENKKYNGIMCGSCNLDSFISDFENISEARESYEWCTRGEHPCKEYDQEKHCCHRWSSFIRHTVEDMKIVHCNECCYAESVDDEQDGYRCNCPEHRNRSEIWFGGDYCSYGERKDF